MTYPPSHGGTPPTPGGAPSAPSGPTGGYGPTVTHSVQSAPPHDRTADGSRQGAPDVPPHGPTPATTHPSGTPPVTATPPGLAPPNVQPPSVRQPGFGPRAPLGSSVPPQGFAPVGPPPPQAGPPTTPPPGMPPIAPPPPKGTSTGAVIAVIAGALAVVVIAALSVTLIIVNTGGGQNTVVGASSTPTTSARDGSAPSTSTPPTTSGDTGAPSADQGTLYAIGDAMQRYVDALNTRDRTRIAATVCSAARNSVQPPTEGGNLVLDQLALRSVNGDVADSTVTTHVELGSQRSSPQQNPATFQREDSTWYYCPGAEPGITA